jgi:hypothetical protein
MFLQGCARNFNCVKSKWFQISLMFSKDSDEITFKGKALKKRAPTLGGENHVDSKASS